MRKLVAILAFILFAPSVYGQTIGASQLKKKTDAGLVGDSSDKLAIGVYRGTSAPATPVAGQLWCDTTITPCTLKIYTGSLWTVTPNLAGIQTGADLTAFPSNPADGQLYYTKNPRSFWIYDSTAANWFGWWGGTVGSYNIPTDTYDPTPTLSRPVSVISGFSFATNANGRVRGTYAHSYKYTCVTATGGETLASPKSADYSGTAGDGIVTMTVPVCAGSAAKRYIYATMENAAALGPWYLVGVIPDNVTTTFNWDLYLWGGSPWSYQTGAYSHLEPAQEFTGAMPAAYSTFNGYTPGNGSYPEKVGGCGVTLNSQIYCRGGYFSSIYGSWNVDPYVALKRDITSNANQNYMIMYRLVYGILPPSSNDFAPYDIIGGMCEKPATSGNRSWTTFYYSYDLQSSIAFARYTEATAKYSAINGGLNPSYPRPNRAATGSLWVKIIHYNVAGTHTYYQQMAETPDSLLWSGHNGVGAVFSHAGNPMNYLDLAVQRTYNADVNNWGDSRGSGFTFDNFSLTVLP